MHRPPDTGTSTGSGARDPALVGLRIAGAAGYLDAETVARAVDAVDRIVAILYRLAYRRA